MAAALLVLGLLISALKWLIIIAAVVFLVGVARGAIAGKGGNRRLS